MSILTQILIIVLVLALFYAVVIHNRADVKKVVDLLPDFKNIFPKPVHHESAFVKVVVFVPDAKADEVRNAVGDAGGGTIGNYSHCSFSSQGMGRFTPGPGSNPSIGIVNGPELVEEERIEFLVSRQNLKNIIEVINKVHPYEEPATDIYPLDTPPGKSDIHSH